MNASQLAALGLVEVGTLPSFEIMVAQVSYTLTLTPTLTLTLTLTLTKPPR